jgi:hypothetical protein
MQTEGNITKRLENRYPGGTAAPVESKWERFPD